MQMCLLNKRIMMKISKITLQRKNIMNPNMSNEELMALVRERGLVDFPETSERQPSSPSLDADIERMPAEIIQTLNKANSVAFIPLKVKTALIDVAISHLLKITG